MDNSRRKKGWQHGRKTKAHVIGLKKLGFTRAVKGRTATQNVASVSTTSNRDKVMSGYVRVQLVTTADDQGKVNGACLARVSGKNKTAIKLFIAGGSEVDKKVMMANASIAEEAKGV